MPRATVNIVVEDALSEAVLTRLIGEARGRPIVGQVYPLRRRWDPESGPNGFGYIRKNLPAFNAAAEFKPHVLLVDLDDNECPPSLINTWRGALVLRSELLLRVAVREVESWLLADKDGLAEYLHVTSKFMPENPERIKDPKRYIVRHAARSSLSQIRSDLVPPSYSKGQTGPAYTRVLASFAKSNWDVDAAAARSESLRRARGALDRI